MLSDLSFEDRHKSSSTREETFDWLLFLRALVNQRNLIGIVTLSSLVAAMIIFSLIPSTYRAETQILIEKTQPAAEQVGSQSVVSSFYGEEDYYGTQIAIITGDEIATALEKELGYPPTSYKLAAKRLYSTQVISITIDAKSALMASTIANHVVKIYIQNKSSDDLFMAQQMLKWLPADITDIDSSVTANMPTLDRDKKERIFGLFSSVANNPFYQNLRGQKVTLEAQISEFSTRYKPGHPAMQELMQKLEYINSKLRESREQLFENLKSNLTGEFHLTNIKILSSAKIPKHPIKPRRVLGVLFCVFLGLFFSVCFVLYREQTDGHVWLETELPKSMQPLFMGYIPETKGLSHEDKKIFRLNKKPAIISQVSPIQSVLKQDPVLADAIAFIRTHLLFSFPAERTKKIMISSVVPNEGKSTVVLLLALSLADMGKKVVVIDADLRRPYLHHHLGVKNESGLSDFLASKASLENVVSPVPGTTISLVTAGSIKDNATHLLASTNRFGELLEALAQKNDYVLVDVPPVLYIPDGMVIAKHIQTAILVCGTGMVRKQIVEAVKHKFDMINNPIAGVIINHVDYVRDVLHSKYFKASSEYYFPSK